MESVLCTIWRKIGQCCRLLREFSGFTYLGISERAMLAFDQIAGSSQRACRLLTTLHTLLYSQVQVLDYA